MTTTSLITIEQRIVNPTYHSSEFAEHHDNEDHERRESARDGPPGLVFSRSINYQSPH